jgi:cobyric acid synthase
VWEALGSARVAGYEIHAGRTAASSRPLLELGAHADGAVSRDGRVAGTYLHGVLEQAEPRQRLIVEACLQLDALPVLSCRPLERHRPLERRCHPEPAKDPHLQAVPEKPIARSSG